MTYAISTLVEGTFDDVLARARSALAGQGFGVLAEIDLSATLKQKLDADLPRQVILGACNPPSALAALRAEESSGLLLPCNVVVRDVGAGQVKVEAIDPQTMLAVTGNDALRPVADRVGTLLRTALASLRE